MSGKNVLIVDDEPTFAQALQTRCQAMGLTASCARDGLHGLMMMVKDAPDLVILDVNMPADGMMLCEKLSRDERLCSVPVIILTGRSDEETIRRCRAFGAHYVFKGLDTWDQLRPVMCRLLDLDAAGSEPVGPAAPPTAAAEPIDAGAAAAAPIRVLVIDDDAEISRALAIRFRPYGVQVLRAFNGMQGFWTAVKEAPDAVITDYTMPDGTGDYVLGRLRSHSVTKDTPVIMLTGKSVAGRPDFALERDMFSLGATAFLSKPVDFDALLAELRLHIALPPVGSPRSRRPQTAAS